MRSLLYVLLAGTVLLAGCSSGGGSDNGGTPPSSGGATPTPPPPPPPPANLSDREAMRFLQQASFGADAEELDDVKSVGLEPWFTAQLSLPISQYTPRLIEESGFKTLNTNDVRVLFWERAIHGQDQLRQRIAFALSQIVVTSLRDAGVQDHLLTFGTYADLLQQHALGNYCQLVRDVTLNPTMGIYLTHLGNQKADPVTGFVPDENYAREVMQLFTIGLEELDAQGQPQGIETYTIDDVEGLAAVFTGLSWANTQFDRPRVTDDNRFLPMGGFPDQHEDAPKDFLGTTVDLGNDPLASIDAALDTLLTHPNVAPFISKQLIQKLVTSNPTPAYVGRVASAFLAGSFELPTGTTVGTGERCDMTATTAAILFDDEARNTPIDPNFGKIRSPLLRYAQVARTFRVRQDVLTTGRFPGPVSLRGLEDSDELGMNAFTSPSVFNFYRPGFVGPGTESAGLGLVTPEFQLATTPGQIGYINEIENLIDGFTLVPGEAFVPVISTDALQAIADDPMALAEEVDRLLTGGMLTDADRTEVAAMIDLVAIPNNNPEAGRERRARLAVVLISTSPAFMVQQ